MEGVALNTQPTQLDAGWTIVTARRSAGSAPKEHGVKKKRIGKARRERSKRAELRRAAVAPDQPGTSGEGTAEHRAGKRDDPKAPATAKRERLDDTVSPRGQPKRPRLERKGEPRPSFADAVRTDLMVAVTTETTGYLTAQQAHEVQDKLQALLIQQAMEPSITTAGPTFRGKPLHTNGVLRLWCEDQNTLTWLNQCLGVITLGTGEKLVIRKQSELPRRVRCGILLPGIWEDMRPVGRSLRYQNPWVEVDRWLLHTVDKQQADTFVIVSIPEDVVQLLMTRGRRLGFMLGAVYVKSQGSSRRFYESPLTHREPHTEADAAMETETAPLQQQQAPLDWEGQGEHEDVIHDPSEDGGECALELGNLALEEDVEEEMLLEDGIPFPTM